MEPCGTAAYASGHHGRHPPAALAPAVPPGCGSCRCATAPGEERRLLLARLLRPVPEPAELLIEALRAVTAGEA
jgi:hypothetical protein